MSNFWWCNFNHYWMHAILGGNEGIDWRRYLVFGSIDCVTCKHYYLLEKCTNQSWRMQHLLVRNVPLTNFQISMSSIWTFEVFHVFLGWFPQLFLGGGKSNKKKQVEVWNVFPTVFRSFVFSGWIFCVFSGNTRHVTDLKWHLTGHLWWVCKISGCEGNDIVEEIPIPWNSKSP